MSYDFSRLTPRQQELLSFGGWYAGRKAPPAFPGPRTVRKLIERGLLVERKRKVASQWGKYTALEYEVPTPVHIAWCERCSRLCKDDE